MQVRRRSCGVNLSMPARAAAVHHGTAANVEDPRPHSGRAGFAIEEVQRLFVDNVIACSFVVQVHDWVVINSGHGVRP